MRALALLPVLVCVACGGGGGGGDPATIDLNGWWEIAGREVGSGLDYEGSFVLPMSHTDDTVVFNRITFTYTPDENLIRGAEPSYADPNRSEWTLSVLSNDRLEGQSVGFSGDVEDGVRDIRLLRVPAPTGSLIVNGAIDMTPYVLHSTSAYATTYADAGGPALALYVHDLHPHTSTTLALQWPQLPPLAATTYTLGGTLTAAQLQTSDNHPAFAGTVEILSFSATHVQGTFDLTLGGGDTIAGSFDVDILLEN